MDLDVKHANRLKQQERIYYMVLISIVTVFVMGFMGKLTSEVVNVTLGIFAYAGNHTFNNMRTSPSRDM